MKNGKNTSNQHHPRVKNEVDQQHRGFYRCYCKERLVTVQQLATTHDLPVRTVLTGKGVRSVGPQVVSTAPKKERVDSSSDFLALGSPRQIVTMDEAAISFHTPEMKRQSKQLVKKGLPGPKKARVHMTRTKKMIFDTKDVIHTNYIPKGKTASAK